MVNLNKLFDCSIQEELVFDVVNLMRPYIKDLDHIEYEFENVDATKQVAGDISGLSQRSLKAIATLFERFSRSVRYDRWDQEVMPILFPFLQDQLEVRLRLLGIYWERMKALEFNTTNPDLLCMADTIGPLTELIEECANWNTDEEESTTQSDLPENCLVG